MTSELNINLIKKYPEIIISAIESTLDTSYDYIEQITNSKGESVLKTEKAKNAAENLRIDTVKYEKVRQKLKKGDFLLSDEEISLILTCLTFNAVRTNAQIAQLLKLKAFLDTAVLTITSKEMTWEECEKKFLEVEKIVNQNLDKKQDL